MLHWKIAMIAFFYHAARIKQWLQYLKCEYAEALSLFEVVKRCHDGVELKRLLDYYGLS